MEGEGPKRLQLSATGPGEVTAGQIATTGDIEVMNPDLVICHLDEGATLNMELTAETGKGYVPAAANRPADAPIGLIPVDALYCPVRQVSYKVENTRVGQELDYDKLTLTVETDGTITPGRRARLCRAHPPGPAPAVRPLRRGHGQRADDGRHGRADRGGDRGRRQPAQPLPAQEGGRARAVGAQRQLPEERQHHLYRRPRPEDRGRDAADAELRPQVA